MALLSYTAPWLASSSAFYPSVDSLAPRLKECTHCTSFACITDPAFRRSSHVKSGGSGLTDHKQRVKTRRAISRSELPRQIRSESSTIPSKEKTEFNGKEQLLKNVQKAIRKYAFHAEDGRRVMARVSKVDGRYEVVVEVSSVLNIRADGTLTMHWRLFRSDSSNSILLDPESVPSGTTFVTGVNDTMQTPLHLGQYGVQTLELCFDSEHVPFFISFELFQPLSSKNKESWIRNASESRFCIPVGLAQGKPEPLGLTIQNDGSANFALYSKNAENVILCLYESKSTEPSLEIDLDRSIHRTGDTWHIELENLMTFTRYGYRCKGEVSWEKGNRFQSRRILLDPYAKCISPFIPGQECLPSPAILLGSLIGENPPFDWEDDFYPELPLESLIAYRLNVTGFTADKSSGLDKSLQGTFEGVAEKVEHLKKLGVNAVILQPIFAFDQSKGCFHPLSFFAPMDRFGPASDSMSASVSLKRMVKKLHKVGIEVILDVVYSHTAEDGDDTPETVSFRGIDNATYYILNKNCKVAGVSECGSANSFNCNHPVVHSMILDSLRHWVIEYHIDGFCFLNAAALTTGPHGEELSRPLLVEAISFDPILARRKVIADSCSSIKCLHKTTRFPHWKRWCEWNGLYRDDVRRFLRGDKGQLSNFATRICGSGDQFSNGRGPNYSINFVAGPYGFTLVDLVSYSSTGLADTEFSWNCGEEGRTINQTVLDTRVRQVHNFLVCLFVSQGLPVLNMGDECGFSKGGSTSINERRTLNWNALLTDYGLQTSKFIYFLATFRSRRKDLLQHSDFINIENVKWHGLQPDQPQWESLDSSFLALSLEPDKDSNPSPGNLYIGFNSQQQAAIAFLPKPPEGMIWHRIADTSLLYPENFTEVRIPMENSGVNESSLMTYEFQPYSCVMLEAHEAT